MITKPSSAPQLKKGETLYTCDGFVDFWNFMSTFVLAFANAKGEGLEVDCTNPSAPKFVPRYM